MNASSASVPFDPAPVVARLAGTWEFLLAEEPEGISLIHFTTAGRAIQFLFDPKTQRRIPMALWYTVESRTHLRFRPHPEKEGWLSAWHLDEGTLTLATKAQRFLCTRPAREELPAWFERALAAELARG